jgi:hypothetical protein
MKLHTCPAPAAAPCAPACVLHAALFASVAYDWQSMQLLCSVQLFMVAVAVAAAAVATCLMFRLHLAPSPTASRLSSRTVAAAYLAGRMAQAAAACRSHGLSQPHKRSSQILPASTAQLSKTADATKRPAHLLVNCSCQSWVTRLTAHPVKWLTLLPPYQGFSPRAQSAPALIMQRHVGHWHAGRAAQATVYVLLASVTAA